METSEVRVGQVFKCARRGHFVKIDAVENRYAYFKNTRGENRRILLERLVAANRFRLILDPAVLPAQEHHYHENEIVSLA